VVRPAIPVGKVAPLKVGTKESDKIVGQLRKIRTTGMGSHRPVCVWKLRPNWPAPRGVARATGTSSSAKIVKWLRQVASTRPDRDVRVVTERVDRTTQAIGVLRGRGRQNPPGSVLRRHSRPSHAASAAGRSRPACNG
jgi:hypothetical protein